MWGHDLYHISFIRVVLLLRWLQCCCHAIEEPRAFITSGLHCFHGCLVVAKLFMFVPSIFSQIDRPCSLCKQHCLRLVTAKLQQLQYSKNHLAPYQISTHLRPSRGQRPLIAAHLDISNYWATFLPLFVVSTGFWID